MPTAGTLSKLASFPDSRLRILNAENGLLIMIESLDRVLAHYTIVDNTGTRFGEQVDLEQDPSGQWHLVTFEVLTPSPLSGNISYYRTTP